MASPGAELLRPGGLEGDRLGLVCVWRSGAASLGKKCHAQGPWPCHLWMRVNAGCLQIAVEEGEAKAGQGQGWPLQDFLGT